MEKVVYINTQGLSVELGGERPFILTKIEGTGAVNANIQSQKSPFQDGVSYLGNTLEPRPISMEVMVLGNNIEEITRHRHRLLQAFNPKLEQGKLIYELGNVKKEIRAISELAPVFPHSGDFSDCMQPGLIQLYCPNPYWLDVYESGELIQTWIKGFQFPLKLPFQLRQRGETRKNICNEGDVETPVEIIFKGPAVNPSVTNLTTNEFIKVNRELTSDDTLYITTERGNKKVEIEKDGKRENAFHFIDLDSTFFSLQAGDNLIEYNTENLEPQSVEIRYRNRYLGI